MVIGLISKSLRSQAKITMIHIPSSSSEQWNTGRLHPVYLHFPVNLFDVQADIDLVGIETVGVPSATTRTERMGGTRCRNTQAYMQKEDILLLDPRVDAMHGWIHGDIQT